MSIDTTTDGMVVEVGKLGNGVSKLYMAAGATVSDAITQAGFEEAITTHVITIGRAAVDPSHVLSGGEFISLSPRAMKAGA